MTVAFQRPRRVIRLTEHGAATLHEHLDLDLTPSGSAGQPGWCP